MRVDIITIFPEYFSPLDVSLLGKARRRGLVDIQIHDLRAWTTDVHRTVDDTPFGGGPGMVMRPEPWGEALDALAARSAPHQPRLIVPTPSGRPFTQTLAMRWSAEPWLIFGCGRYEGIDARVAQEAAAQMEVEEVSVGDYVLAGGEVAVLVVLEAVIRLLPGVVGNAESITEDSFSVGEMAGLLEGPVYTRPAVWRGRAVPDVLRSGNHQAIARWRAEQARRRTAERRPELLGQELPPASAGMAE
jgi:tRNA (guanine37-N1)-methyltransferase